MSLPEPQPPETKTTGFESRTPEFKSRCYSLLAVLPWTRLLPSLVLSMLIYKNGDNKNHSRGLP